MCVCVCVCVRVCVCVTRTDDKNAHTGKNLTDTQIGQGPTPGTHTVYRAHSIVLKYIQYNIMLCVNV